MNSPQRFFSALAVASLAAGLSACEQSVAGSCSTAQDVAGKLSSLVDDLNASHDNGHLALQNVGEIGASIIDAGTSFGKSRNHQAYCSALEKIRRDARLK